MTRNFSTLIEQAQKCIAATLVSDDFNPVSVISSSVTDVVSELTRSELIALSAERPHILDYKPTNDYILEKRPSALETLRACVQIEIETNIDVSPHSALIKKWLPRTCRPPEHLFSKLHRAAQAE
jgi:hypothetical protein